MKCWGGEKERGVAVVSCVISECECVCVVGVLSWGGGMPQLYVGRGPKHWGMRGVRGDARRAGSGVGRLPYQTGRALQAV